MKNGVDAPPGTQPNSVLGSSEVSGGAVSSSRRAHTREALAQKSASCGSAFVQSLKKKNAGAFGSEDGLT